MSASDSDAEQFELVDAPSLAKEIVEETKPDLDKIRSWLSPTEHDATSSEYRRHLSSQAAGTGHWIRETQQFKQWHESNEHGSLWIKAAPGAGKSVVAASLVDSLLRQENAPVLYFFFRQIIETNRTYRCLIKDFLAQALPHSEILQVSLWEIVEDGQDLATVSNGRLWKLLVQALKHTEKVYVVVDALDEVDYDEGLFDSLDTLGAVNPDRIKVLMTSRPKEYLQRTMKNPQVIHVSLEEELVNRDITVYVRQRVRLNASPSLTDTARDIIQQTICCRCHGLFLYARLMLDQIFQAVEEERPVESQILCMVEQLPVGLEEMYDAMLTDCASSSRASQATQMLMLQFVTHSARPLRLIELAQAVEASSCPEPAGINSKDIIRLGCGPLLEIMEDGCVQILHHSFTEFLLDDSRAQRGMTRFPVIDPRVAHREIALSCFNRLYNSGFKDYDIEKTLEKTGLRRTATAYCQKAYLHYPLLHYATQYWTYHARHCDLSGADLNILETFCSVDNPSYQAWIFQDRQFGPRHMSNLSDLSLLTHLHIAAHCGLLSWAKHLIASGADVDARDKTGNSPLLYTTQRNYAEIAEELLHAGANPDITGSQGHVPLREAVSANASRIVKLLVEAGVSPVLPKLRDKNRHGSGRSLGSSYPLMMACEKGHTESVLEMLPHVTDRADLEHALCYAATNGQHDVIIALLNNTNVSANAKLEAGVDPYIDAREGHQTALMLAVRALSPSCVSSLLERGADVHLPSHVDVKLSRLKNSLYDDGAHPMPIHGLAATEITQVQVKAFSEILDLLLDAGVTLEDRDPVSQATPFLYANCRSSYPQRKKLGSRTARENGTDDESVVAKILAKAGANINAIDKNGENLLHRYLGSFRTSTTGLEGILQLGVDPRIPRYSDGATPLHCVLRREEIKVESANLLVEYGADVNAKDHDGNTPLHLASSSVKYVTTIQALVERGANINTKNGLGQTALHVMRLRPSNIIDAGKPLKFALEAGADPQIRDYLSLTPFLAALEAGDITFVHVLLEYTRVNIHDRLQGKTALHLACALQREPVQLVEKLVDYGCDPLAVDSQGNTLLHEAARCQRYPGDTGLAESLIRLGVDANARNNLGRKAIHIMSPSDSSETFSVPVRTRTMVELLVQEDPEHDVNAQDNGGYTALHIAAAMSEAQSFGILKAGADPLMRTYDGRTALHCAAGGQQVNTVAMLLDFAREAGVVRDAVQAVDDRGRTPLWDACKSRRPESVRMLLDAGADPQVADNSGLPPLVACVEGYHQIQRQEFESQQSASDNLQTTDDELKYEACRVEQILDTMVAAGAEISVALRAVTRLALPDHNNAEDVLRRKRTSEVGWAEDVLEQASDSDTEWGTTLNSWVAHGLTDKVTEVIRHKGLPSTPEVPLDSPDLGSKHSGKPLLQIACERSTWNLDMIKLLVEVGSADVNGRRHYKISNGSDSDPHDITSGETALHVLAAGKYYWTAEAIRYLVEHGAEINAVNKSSHTPLDVACDAKDYRSWVSHSLFSPRCAETLLQLGANPNLVDQHGRVTLRKAGRHIDTVHLLLQHGANVNKVQRSLIVTAVECADVSLLQLYFEHGGDPSAADSSEGKGLANWPRNDHWYPLLIAAMPAGDKRWDTETSTKITRLLLEYGARVDSPVHDEHTLIHYLFERTTTAWLRAFIDRHDIDMNIRDQSGRTVFLAACSCAALLEKSADRFAYLTDEQRKQQMALYQPSHLALAASPSHGPKIDYLATSNDGSNLWHHGIQGVLSRNLDFARPLLRIPGVRELMRQRNDTGFLPLHLALAKPSVPVEMCEFLIADGPTDLLEADPNGDTALHHIIRRACWTKHSGLAERYHALGGDINARNDLGETPLHLLPFTTLWKPDYAERVTDPLEFLIEKGVDLQAITNDGSTILHILARQARTGNTTGEKAARPGQVFKRLVQLGCDPLTEDAVGRSALDVAAECGGKSILELYQRRKAVNQRAT